MASAIADRTHPVQANEKKKERVEVFSQGKKHSFFKLGSPGFESRHSRNFRALCQDNAQIAKWLIELKSNRYQKIADKF